MKFIRISKPLKFGIPFWDLETSKLLKFEIFFFIETLKDFKIQNVFFSEIFSKIWENFQNFQNSFLLRSRNVWNFDFFFLRSWNYRNSQKFKNPKYLFFWDLKIFKIQDFFFKISEIIKILKIFEISFFEISKLSKLFKFNIRDVFFSKVFFWNLEILETNSFSRSRNFQNFLKLRISFHRRIFLSCKISISEIS